MKDKQSNNKDKVNTETKPFGRQLQLKTVIDDKVISDMCEQIEQFVSPIVAAQLVGIDEDTFYLWMDKGYKKRKACKVDKFRHFFDSVMLSSAKAE